MVETADAVVMTCIENPHREVEGLESRTFSVHAVLCVPKGFEEIYVTKIIAPENIASKTANQTSAPLSHRPNKRQIPTHSSKAGRKTANAAVPGQGVS